MAYQVIWSVSALEDVEAIATYIAHDSIAYAAAVVKKVLDSTKNLQAFPFAGRIVPELVKKIFARSSHIAIELSTAFMLTL